MAWFDTGRPKSGLHKREKTVVFDGTSDDAQNIEVFQFGEGAQAAYQDGPMSQISEVKAEVLQEPVLYTESDMQQAREEGFEAGCMSRAAEDEDSLESMQANWATQLEEVCDEFYRWRLERTGQMQEALLQMTHLMCGAILEDHFKEIPESYVHIAGQLVERAVGFETLRLHVPPEAAPYVERELDALRRKHPDYAQIEVQADAQMHTGDCQLRIEGGVIDGRLRERLEQMLMTMRETLLHTPVLEP